MAFDADLTALRASTTRLAELDQCLSVAESDPIMATTASVKRDYVATVRAEIRKEIAAIQALTFDD